MTQNTCRDNIYIKTSKNLYKKIQQFPNNTVWCRPLENDTFFLDFQNVMLKKSIDIKYNLFLGQLHSVDFNFRIILSL